MGNVAASGRQSPFADRALTWMVGIIVVDVFFICPLAETFSNNPAWFDLSLTIVLVLGALVVWGNLLLADVFVATGIVTIATRLAAILMPEWDLRLYDALFAALNLFLLSTLIGRRVLAPGRINAHRIQGAIAVYLLVGLLFGQVFRAIALHAPGAFLYLGKPAAYSDIVQHLTYFSFVSLTTLGFGDITPVHPIAKSMTLLAAVFGTLYPAVLIGRLVSQELLHQR
ncbi:MAG: two pore domain potassium channel family protein [Rhodocyclaceae bacterium]|nr:two pore domain potassium channel family protein [Rhodocyclaceae bacterium]MCE2723500.1 potassium channel family protein [Betaproteobacteria bacterium]MCA3017681.1 two pore domain potassium channel family protein [Rhodocyclaceae bacterium]MCA3024026.1 two pore domain potassium channel family protein [Rhodocyclaceae bacterium]MCA3026971.1 two pore domain potassium channel family protein [Rhodocyclaceae bacterium]